MWLIFLWFVVSLTVEIIGVMVGIQVMGGLYEMTKEWVEAAALRAVRTMAQTAVATIGTAAAMGEVNWTMVFSASALSGILSALMSIAGLPEVKKEED